MNKLEGYIKAECIKVTLFAKRIGTSVVNLKRITKGLQKPSVDLAYKIELATKGDVTMYDWVDKLPEDFDIHEWNNKKMLVETLVNKKPRKRRIKKQ